ncbi:glutathione-dependent formaldehyde-activating, GFA [Tothia fuscella]|uniref:Glutathione-dependent formaldehyde-activating, GFA n=1 Tax=Tothia fuscella TaxID=1048955 RepID=A0A9P4TXM7_9PEZI|nr:glutathione-dependent formaldehyde-activating, GFA [Tothia fuscella]
MSSSIQASYTGGCACGHIRYTLNATPLIIHCCHCYICQKENGSAFALNLLIESDKVTLDNSSEKPLAVRTPTDSGKGQLISRCPKCYVAVWSHYAGAGPYIAFVKVGTLDGEMKKNIVPDIHIFAASKPDWLKLPEDALISEEFYKMHEVWSKQSLERFSAMKAEISKWKEDVGSFWIGEIETLKGNKLDTCLARLKV